MMDAEKLAHYREILTRQLRQHTEMVRENQSDALEMAAADDGVKDVADMSVQDVSQEIEYRLSERASQTVADIDQALMRIDEGSYGVCARCGRDIPERRLDALPTARYDAECQTLIEQSTGEDEHATL
jgi:DnaK suppressor protein